jgi:hypothetical protein
VVLGIVETASAADIRLVLTGTDGRRLLRVIRVIWSARQALPQFTQLQTYHCAALSDAQGAKPDSCTAAIRDHY